MTGDFVWDPRKEAANYRKHKVHFDQAMIAFDDPFAMVELDSTEDYGEDRYVLTGIAHASVLVVVFTEHDERIRIISARKANSYEHRAYRRATQKK